MRIVSKKNKISSLFGGLLPMFIKKFIFYLKMWHFKAILFKMLVLQVLHTALRLKKNNVEMLWSLICKCLRKGSNSTLGPEPVDKQFTGNQHLSSLSTAKSFRNFQKGSLAVRDRETVQSFLSNPLCGMLKISQKSHTDALEWHWRPLPIWAEETFCAEPSAAGLKLQTLQ